MLGNIAEDGRSVKREISGIDVVNRERGGRPDHRDDSLEHHHPEECGAGLTFARHRARYNRALGRMKAGDDTAGDSNEKTRE